jgi:hypothetical protein
MPQITFELSSRYLFWASLLALLAGFLILIRPRPLN